MDEYIKQEVKAMGKRITQVFFLVVGSLLFTVGIDGFLIPNQVIDGGIVGISIISAHVTGWNFGLLLIVLNLPFVYLGYRRLGRNFAIATAFAIVLVAIISNGIHHFNFKGFTGDPLLAAVFGGIFIGVGIGIIIRHGRGSMDGTEIMALVISRKSPFSVGEIVMFFNVFILLSAGFVFSWDRAMYSLIAYFVAFKAIDLVIEGFDETRQVFIVSDIPKEVGGALIEKMNRGVTYLDGEGGYAGEKKKVIMFVCSRMEETEIKTIIKDVDPRAFITIGHINEVKGGSFADKAAH